MKRLLLSGLLPFALTLFGCHHSTQTQHEVVSPDSVAAIAGIYKGAYVHDYSYLGSSNDTVYNASFTVKEINNASFTVSGPINWVLGTLFYGDVGYKSSNVYTSFGDTVMFFPSADSIYIKVSQSLVGIHGAIIYYEVFTGKK